MCWDSGAAIGRSKLAVSLPEIVEFACVEIQVDGLERTADWEAPPI